MEPDVHASSSAATGAAEELDRIIREAYRLVEPSRDDRAKVDSIAERYLKSVRSIASEHSEINDVILVGSYAKDTWLPESVDIDIFLKIRQDVDEARFEKIAIDVGRRALHDSNPYLRYAQHPYVEALVDGVRVNVVPCYDVELGRWKSAADRSPYHTQYMLKALDDVKRREVRLLKRFMKVIGVYGAEIAVQGFSGYACEVLILRYGSLVSTLESAEGWREGEVITVHDTGSIKSDEKMMDDRRSRNSSSRSPIMILDPVDPKRNLGLAISYESLGRFMLSARNFLKRPSMEYFTYTDESSMAGAVTATASMMLMDQEIIKNIVMVHFRHSQSSEDIVWGQLKSTASSIARQLSIHEFKVLRYACYTDGSNALISFMLESLSIPRITLRLGPKVFDRRNAERFIAKNRSRNRLLWVSNEDGRLLALRERRFYNVRNILNHIMSRGLEQSGVSKGLIDDIRKNGFVVYTWDDVKEFLSGEHGSSPTAGAVKKMVRYMAVNDRFAFPE